MNEKTLDSLSEKNRELQAEFNSMLEDFKEGLWRYCRYLTGSPWDGEDLFQDTMVKAFGGYYQRWHPTNPKAYLYRMATTTWIDQCRRIKKNVGIVEDYDMPFEELADGLEVEEALTVLCERFEPRLVAVFLLKEVFRFNAGEVAGMVRTTEGAVYGTVRRMKEKLQGQSPEKIPQKVENVSHPIIQTYLKALNEGDIEAVLSLINEDVHNEAALGFQEYSKDEMRSGSMKYGLPGMLAEEHVLWGRNVVVVFAEGKDGREIHDIQYQEVENGKIVHHISFYFRKEFIFAAAKELGFLPQIHKPVVKW